MRNRSLRVLIACLLPVVLGGCLRATTSLIGDKSEAVPLPNEFQVKVLDADKNRIETKAKVRRVGQRYALLPADPKKSTDVEEIRAKKLADNVYLIEHTATSSDDQHKKEKQYLFGILKLQSPTRATWGDLDCKGWPFSTISTYHLAVSGIGSDDCVIGSLADVESIAHDILSGTNAGLSIKWEDWMISEVK